MTCPALETIAAWTLDELAPDTAEQFEEHYFSCDVCFARATRLHRLVAELDASLPPLLTNERRRKLEGAEPGLLHVDVQAGEHGLLRMGAAAPLGLWVMHAPLGGVERVDFEARAADGTLLFAHRDVPFDAERGEVVLACQLHYRALPTPPTLHVRLTGTDAAGAARVSEYTLEHEFESL